MLNGSRLRPFMLSTSMLLAAPAAWAQATDGNTLARMNAIEAQIRALQNELRSMRSDLASRDRQLRAAQQEAARARETAARAERAARTTRPAQLATGAPPSVAVGAPSSGALAGGVGGPGEAPTASQQNASTTPAPTPLGTFRLGGVTITLGGYIEGAAIYRSRNEVADISSNFNTGIPLPNTVQSHQDEFRASARQSRVSVLVTGKIDQTQTLTGYVESDFQSAAPTANSNESNSYNPRLRQAYATYDNSEYHVSALAGQSWSLVTPFKTGITPRKEDTPPTIDAQIAVGFTWARQPQFRVVGTFPDDHLAAGLSFENPETNYSIGPNGAGVPSATVTTSLPGGSGFASTTNYSSDIAPDIVAKIAWDPGFGHYEAVGLLRFMQSRVTAAGTGSNKVTVAGGGGVATIIPIIKDRLEFHGNVLAGAGIGRYGSAQLPDATISPSGAPDPLPEVEALAGLIGHPNESSDLYLYGGTEQVGRRSFAQGGKGYGYGSPLYVNTGCYVELGISPCQANTSGIVEGTVGGWWRFLHGSYGTAEVGAQYEYLHRSIFSGVGGNKGTDDNVVLLSFRYLPFQ